MYICNMNKKQFEQKNGKPCVYIIKNLIDNKVYVGSTISHYRKKGQHYYRLRRGDHDNNLLQNAWNYYGEINFSFEVLEFFELEDLKNKSKLYKREQYYMDFYKSTSRKFGYNKAPEAGTNLGRKMSNESRKKMSESHTGKKLSKKHIENIVKATKKKILQFDKENNFIQEFNSIQEASDTLKIDRTSISKSLSNNSKVKSAGGFVWRYKNLEKNKKYLN